LIDTRDFQKQQAMLVLSGLFHSVGNRKPLSVETRIILITYSIRLHRSEDGYSESKARTFKSR